MSINHLLAVGVGGFLGAISRYSINLAISQTKFLSRHHATLFANLLGCFLAGYCLYYFANRFKADHILIYFVGIGFLGSMTTFSAFSVELFQFFDARQWQQVISHMLLNLVLGFILVLLGHRLARYIFN